MLFGLLVFGAIVGLLFAFVATYNGLVAAAEKATRAWNELDALLRQRHDEIPKLIESAEARLRNNPATIERLREARAAVFAARQTRNADGLSHAEAQLRAAAMAFTTLDLELADRRDRYNDAVRDYNAAIGRLPGRLVALVGEFRPLRPLDFGGG
jgi:LemA protein